MLKFEHTETYGFGAAMRGMRNAKQSWHLNDTIEQNNTLYIGTNDLKLAKTLRKAGESHRKYLRMIQVWTDIVAPAYWIAEFATYKIGTTMNSTSLQHTGASRDFEIVDFAVDESSDAKVWVNLIGEINKLRREFKNTGNYDIFRQMRQLIPQSYLYRITVNMSYETILNMYTQRKSHSLKEWSKDFVQWVDKLPYFKELCLDE